MKNKMYENESQTEINADNSYLQLIVISLLIKLQQLLW